MLKRWDTNKNDEDGKKKKERKQQIPPHLRGRLMNMFEMIYLKKLRISVLINNKQKTYDEIKKLKIENATYEFSIEKMIQLKIFNFSFFQLRIRKIKINGPRDDIRKIKSTKNDIIDFLNGKKKVL